MTATTKAAYKVLKVYSMLYRMWDPVGSLTGACSICFQDTVDDVVPICRVHGFMLLDTNLNFWCTSMWCGESNYCGDIYSIMQFSHSKLSGLQLYLQFFLTPQHPSVKDCLCIQLNLDHCSGCYCSCLLVMRSRHYRAFAWGRHGQRDRKFGQTDGFYLVKNEGENLPRFILIQWKCRSVVCLDVLKWGAKYMHFTRWRGFFFLPDTRTFLLLNSSRSWGMVQWLIFILHETNPKQLTQWWAPIRRELTVPYHGGATWGDFSAGTSLP